MRSPKIKIPKVDLVTFTKESLNEEFYDMIGIEFNKYATKNGVSCNYKPFNFVAKENDKIIGIITGNSYYNEVKISDLIVLEEYRNKHIGTKLVEAVENYYKNKIYHLENAFSEPL